MKAILVFACLALAATSASASGRHARSTRSSYRPAAVHVSGYVKRNGTYVQPHYQTTPDNSRRNNWSSKPNVNPYTGKPGTVDPVRQGGLP